jgi:hypothetical protein
MRGSGGLLGVLAGALALALVVLTASHLGSREIEPQELLEKLKGDGCDSKCQAHKALVAKQSVFLISIHGIACNSFYPS